MFMNITWQRSAVGGNQNQIHASNKWETVYKSVWQCSYLNICDALHNLVPFAQFKKREEHPYVFYF